jgi:hypothetical protein
VWGRRFRWCVAVAAAVFGLFPPQPCAATSLKDIQVGIRGVEFLTDPPRGRVEVAIIRDPQNKGSEQDAEAIEGWVVAASTDKIDLAPILVDIRDLDRAPPVRIAIVARGLEPYFDQILAFARHNGTLTITADLACVRSGNCILGVVTEPNVEVIVNRRTSLDCGLDFVRAFRMMVKEY